MNIWQSLKFCLLFSTYAFSGKPPFTHLQAWNSGQKTVYKIVTGNHGIQTHIATKNIAQKTGLCLSVLAACCYIGHLNPVEKKQTRNKS